MSAKPPAAIPTQRAVASPSTTSSSPSSSRKHNVFVFVDGTKWLPRSDPAAIAAITDEKYGYYCHRSQSGFPVLPIDCYSDEVQKEMLLKIDSGREEQDDVRAYLVPKRVLYDRDISSHMTAETVNKRKKSKPGQKKTLGLFGSSSSDSDVDISEGFNEWVRNRPQKAAPGKKAMPTAEAGYTMVYVASTNGTGTFVKVPTGPPSKQPPAKAPAKRPARLFDSDSD